MNLYEIFWLSTLLGNCFSWFTLVKEFKGYTNTLPAPHNPYPKLIFLYAAREANLILSEVSKSIPTACKAVGLDNYEIIAVTNKQSDLQIPHVRVIVTPLDYQCGSLFKARQLNYVLRYLPSNENVWILHLDEDAKILPQTISAILNYIKQGGNPIANGPSYFPYSKNIWASFIEAQRYWTFYWLKWQMKVGWCLWANGSNLLVRSDIEQSVAWDFPKLKYSEDTRFIYEAYKKYGNITGWHGGVTIEQPPKSIISAIKQRMRWFYGGLLQFPYIPRFRLPERVYRSFCWLMGFVLTLMFPLGLAGISTGHTLFMTGVVFALTGFFWILRYQIGLYLNNKYSSLSLGQKVMSHLLLAASTPLIDFVCTVPTVLSLVFRPKGFTVTEKTG